MTGTFGIVCVFLRVLGFGSLTIWVLCLSLLTYTVRILKSVFVCLRFFRASTRSADRRFPFSLRMLT